MSELTSAQFSESKEWAVEIGQEEFGERWREFAPLLIRRIPKIIDEYRTLERELEAAKLRADTAQTGADEDKSLAQRYLNVGRAAGAETPEALSDAIRGFSSRATALERERDDLATSLADVQDVLDAKADEIEELRPLVAELAAARSRLDELQQVFEDVQSRHEEMHQRTLTLEESLEDAQETLRTTKRDYEERLAEVQAEWEDTVQRAYLSVRETEEALRAKEVEIQHLTEKLQSLKDNVNEALVT